MPWQRQVADVLGELVELNGETVPAYRELIVTVPRQSGKTSLVLSAMIQRAWGWGKPQKLAYSAQTGNDARKKLVEDWEPLLRPRRSKLGISRILKGMGNEGIEFLNGSRIVLLASSEEAGHGKTLQFAVKDELFADADFRRDQALVPAMSTVDEAQVLTTSTAGTDASVALNAAVDRGRAAVGAGSREGVAYFEWSASEDDDLDDPDCWWSFMPALGHTQSVRSIMASRDILAGQPGEFRRAFGNLAMKVDERVIPAAAWDECCSPTVTPSGSVTFGVDVNPERSHSAIGVADSEGRVELLEHRQGTDWVVGRVLELAGRWNGNVALDPGGPAGGFRNDIDRKVKVVDVGGRELGQACGAFYDDVVAVKAQVRRHVSLDAAVAGAQKRVTGDTWTWSRKTAATDVSPLMAVTVAYWVALHRKFTFAAF
jgi:hypothetical protein